MIIWCKHIIIVSTEIITLQCGGKGCMQTRVTCTLIPADYKTDYEAVTNQPLNWQQAGCALMQVQKRFVL